MKRGFTLIELLVVIGIIAVLAAILFPVFSAARQKAQQASCLNNMAQLAHVIGMYATDHSGYMLPWGHGPIDALGNNAEAQGFFSWDTILEKDYHLGKGMYICPSNPIGQDLRGYAVARYAVGQPERHIMVYKEHIRVPSETILLFDKGAHALGQCGDAAGENPIQSHGCSTVPPETKEMFHNGGKNFAYVDGHAKWSAQNSGPFVAFSSGATDPMTGYEPHTAGHCEFSTDRPQLR